MAKNANFVSHKKSKQIVDGKPKLPLASDLVKGEIAINFGKDVKTLSIKNESGDVVTFSSDNYYTEKKLGSGFTDENSGVTVTEAILWVSGTGENAVVLKNSSGTASGNFSVAEGYQTSATSNYSHAEGGGTTASGLYSHAEGMSTSATSNHTHAEGISTLASGPFSHAEGQSTIASGINSHAEGYNTIASGVNSHAEGFNTIASGESSHAEGFATVASGYYSHAEGHNTEANGYYSHAEGYYTTASSVYSHAEGYQTIANNKSEHASGQYNVSSSASTEFGNSGNTLFSVGNGTEENARHNAFEIRQNGDIYIVNKDGNDVKLQDEIGNITVDQVIDSGTSASTNAVSTKAVVDKLIEDEQVWAISLNELNNKKFGYANFDSTNRTIDFYKDEDDYTSGGTAIDSVDLSDISIDIDQVIDSGTSASTDAVSTSAVYGFVTSYTPSITVDQVLDNTTSASTNPVSSKAVYDAVTDNELVWTNAYVALSGAVSAHTIDTNIHITSADRAKLNSITGTFGTMAYEDKASYSSATEVNTALGNKAETTALTQVNNTLTAHTADTTIHVTAADKTAWNAKVDASAIADFFDDAKYEDSGSTKVINFYHGNTIKATIDASDFIVDGMVDDVRIENGNLVIDFNTASGKQDISIPLTDIFDPSNYYDKDDIDTLVGSGFTSSSITEVIIENEEIVSAALTDLDERKLDASAYTPTDLSNYYTKSETSGATQISNALGGKVNSATFTGHTADTSVHFTTGAVQTQIDDSISGKVNTSDIVTAITSSNSGSTNPIATNVVAENELTVSAALNDLSQNKADKSTTYTKTEIDAMIGYIETLLAAI